jgi:hypothetical protein
MSPRSHEGHEGFGNYYISIFLLRALRDLHGEMFVSILVAALPRSELCGEYFFTENPE